MPLETATKISEFNTIWPSGGDYVNKGDDHVRMMKEVMQNDVVSAIDGGTFLNSVTIDTSGETNLTLSSQKPRVLFTDVDAPDTTASMGYDAGVILFEDRDNTGANPQIIARLPIDPAGAASGNDLLRQGDGDARYAGQDADIDRPHTTDTASWSVTGTELKCYGKGSSTSGLRTITFPKAFAKTPVVTAVVNTSTEGARSVKIETITATTFSFRTYDETGSESVSPNIQWFAIGVAQAGDFAPQAAE